MSRRYHDLTNITMNQLSSWVCTHLTATSSPGLECCILIYDPLYFINVSDIMEDHNFFLVRLLKITLPVIFMTHSYLDSVIFQPLKLKLFFNLLFFNYLYFLIHTIGLSFQQIICSGDISAVTYIT